MAVRRIKNHGKWVWRARVAYRGRHRAAFVATRELARDEEARLRAELKAEAEREEQEGATPATLRQLLELYLLEMESRGKGAETVLRAASTLKALERLCPDLLTRPVNTISDRDVFAFRAARAREGKRVRVLVAAEKVERLVPAKPSTINRDMRTLRAALKRARPDYRFPAGAFFPEDETRVRWLRPEEELLVLEPMPSPVREIAKLAALTLMRLSEIRLLRLEDVHLEQGVIMLPRAKGGARPSCSARPPRTS